MGRRIWLGPLQADGRPTGALPLAPVRDVALEGLTDKIWQADPEIGCGDT